MRSLLISFLIYSLYNCNVEETTITYYCPCKICCGKYGEKFTTADGTYFKGNFDFKCIAADTRKYKFGTKLKIDEVIYIVHDTGSAIKGNKIDVLVYPCADLKICHKEALKLGIKKVKGVKNVSVNSPKK